MTNYRPSDTRYDTMRYNRCGRSGLKLPGDLAGAVAQLWRRGYARERPRHGAARRSTWASPTSTWPTTTARRPARPRRPSASILRKRSRRLPRRADHLHQGRLRYVAGPVRRVGIAQVPDRQPGPEPASAWGWSTWTSSTTTAPTRRRRWKRRWARWIRSCAAARRSMSASPTIRRADAPGGRNPARPGHALPDPPAALQHVQPLGRGRPAGRAGGGGHRLHRLFAAGAGPAYRPLPDRHPGGFARGQSRTASCSPSRSPTRSWPRCAA